MIGRHGETRGVSGRVSRALRTSISLSLPDAYLGRPSLRIKSFRKYSEGMVKTVASLSRSSTAVGALRVSPEKEAICQPI